MKMLKKYQVLSIFAIIIFGITSCNKDNIEPDSNSTEIKQPIPVAPDNTFSGTIGFWDFNGSGENGVSMSVPGRSGDWVIEGINYDGQGLVLDGNVSENDALSSRVKLANPNGNNPDQGLARQRYFSGAIRFKVEQDPDEAFSFPILSFGLNPRFLDLEIVNGKIQMATDNSNIVKPTDIEVVEDFWNVLYFRYEGFLPPNDNKFYIQLNDGEEVVIDLEDFDIDEFANNDDDINLGFSSRGFIFKGNVDWVILGLGRMKPENAQYLVEGFQN